MEGVIGYVTLFAGNFAPKDWAFCNGALMQIRQNAALFSVIGNTYGGDGNVTFALPDLRGRAIVGAGSLNGNNYNPGNTGGAEFIFPLTQDHLPIHTHPLQVVITSPAGGVANSNSPVNAAYAASASNLYNATPTPGTFTAQYNAALSTTVMGSDNPAIIPSLHPVMGLNYIICLSGKFPPRE